MLQDFTICINTDFVFGRDAQRKVGEKLTGLGVKKVLIHHDNGKFLYDTNLLEDLQKDLDSFGIAYTELGGVLPNPRLTLVYQGIELVKREEIDFVLAIGGGSVID